MDPLTLASMGVSMFGSLFQGIMGFNSGNAQAKAYMARAEQAGSEAGVAAQQKIIQGDQVAARDAVGAAANGGGFTGSAIGVINQASENAQFNARAAAYRGATQEQADAHDAEVAHANAQNSLISGIAGATGGAIGQGLQSAYRKQILSDWGSRTGDITSSQDPTYGLP